jgi:hypothetical protein
VVQRLRDWQRRRSEAECERRDAHSAQRLLAQRENGKLFLVLLPYAEAVPFRSHVAARFVAYVALACLSRKCSALIGSLGEIATLLGCSPRSVENAVTELVAGGWLRVHARFASHPEGFRARDGEVIEHRQLANAYAPGPLLELAWQQYRAQKGNPPVPSPPTKRVEPAPLAARCPREEATAQDLQGSQPLRSVGYIKDKNEERARARALKVAVNINHATPSRTERPAQLPSSPTNESRRRIASTGRGAVLPSAPSPKSSISAHTMPLERRSSQWQAVPSPIEAKAADAPLERPRIEPPTEWFEFIRWLDQNTHKTDKRENARG